MYKDYFELKIAFASVNYLQSGLLASKIRFYDKKYFSIYELQKLVYNLEYVNKLFIDGTTENKNINAVLKTLEETIGSIGDILSGENILNQLQGVNGFLNNLNTIVQNTTSEVSQEGFNKVKDYTTQLWNRRHLYQHPPQIKQGIVWEICKTGDELRRLKPKWRLLPNKVEHERYLRRCILFIEASKQLLMIYDKYTVNNDTVE